MEKIVVTIDADANVKVEAVGCSGSGCGALTRAMEQALGKTVQDQKKPEFHRTTSQVANQGQSAKQK